MHISLFFALILVARASLYPEQVHIALGERARSLHVSWVTGKRTASTELELCRDGKCTMVSGYSKKWLYKHKKKQSAPIPRYLHHIDLLSLTPSSLYTYRVGSVEANIWSRNFTFLGPSQDSVGSSRSKNSSQILIFADFGTCSDLSKATLQALIAEAETMKDEAFIHTGDIAYDLEHENGEKGDQYMRAVEPFASRVPYHVVVGNHEGHQNFTHFKHRFTMPGSGDNMYYSLNLGPLHLVMYSSEVFCGKAKCETVRKSQLQWLTADLERAQRERNIRPWVVAFAHKPMYCSADWTDIDSVTDCHLQPLDMRSEYEDLLAAFHVDIHFHGHVHSYERTLPLYQGSSPMSRYSSDHLIADAQAPLYIIEGSAGTCRPHDIAFPSSVPEDWSVFRSSELGFTRITADMNILKVTRLRSADRQPEDYLYLVKSKRKDAS